MKYEEWDRGRKAPAGLCHQATCMLADWTEEREQLQTEIELYSRHRVKLQAEVEEYKGYWRDEQAAGNRLEAEVERLQKTIDEGIISVASDEANYQRRRRKWALHQLYSCREFACAWKQCADKAEADKAKLVEVVKELMDPDVLEMLGCYSVATGNKACAVLKEVGDD